MFALCLSRIYFPFEFRICLRINHYGVFAFTQIGCFLLFLMHNRVHHNHRNEARNVWNFVHKSESLQYRWWWKNPCFDVVIWITTHGPLITLFRFGWLSSFVMGLFYWFGLPFNKIKKKGSPWYKFRGWLGFRNQVYLFFDLASCVLGGGFVIKCSQWHTMGLFCCVSVANKDCTCLVTTYNQLRKLWENKDKQNQMSHNPSHYNGAGPCSLHSGEGALHASMFGSNGSLGWLLPLFVSSCFRASKSAPVGQILSAFHSMLNFCITFVWVISFVGLKKKNCFQFWVVSLHFQLLFLSVKCVCVCIVMCLFCVIQKQRN